MVMRGKLARSTLRCEVKLRKACVRAPNPKVVRTKGLPKITYLCKPVYRKMIKKWQQLCCSKSGELDAKTPWSNFGGL
uniref:Uncharacterized protein n=1 Tax=Oryza punctata TaxID=4537 RepID=A0A0E0JI65_ORYPU